MFLDRLEIQNFRGVKGDYVFEAEGENAIIVGPNGSGKSSILEAIDFLLTNEITHLDLDGIGRGTKNEVIAHVHSDGPCLVTGQFSSDDANHVLTRDLESRALDPPLEDHPTEIQKIIEHAKQGQHILTRSELLDLIIAQPKSRREAFTEILNLPDVDERRLILQRTRKKIEEEKDDSEAARDSRVKRLNELCDADVSDHDALEKEVLNTINHLRETFGADPIDEINPDIVRKGVKSPADQVATEALHREQPQRELERLISWTGEYEQHAPGLINQLLQDAEDLEQKRLGAPHPERLPLLEIGLDVIDEDADICPLCEQDWEPAEPLRVAVTARIQELQELNDLADSISRLRDELRSLLREARDPINYLIKELDEQTYPPVKSLLEAQQTIEESIDALSSIEDPTHEDLVEVPIVKRSDKNKDHFSEDVRRALGELVESIPEESAIEETENKYENIRSLAEEWNEYENLIHRVNDLSSLYDDVDMALSAFIAAREEVMRSIYEQIEERVDSYYEQIHPDESGTSTSIIVTETGAELSKDFYDSGEFTPHSIHSEGHLDTLGLCLHLALADYLKHGETSLLLLDDVVMSVDEDHRLSIARLIADEFAEDYQLIITTHDQLWAEQLRTQGALRGGNIERLREWSLDAGVVESRSYIDVYEQWEKVDEAVDANEMRQAAHELRYATERMLQQSCMALGGKVRLDPRLRYTLGDYKNAVSGRLGTIIGKARANLNPQNEEDEEMWEITEELNDKYGKLLNDVGNQLQKVNRQVHWTPGKWLSLRPEEFQEVFETHKKAYDFLFCDNCGSSIRYEEFNGYHELRCNCREHLDLRWD